MTTPNVPDKYAAILAGISGAGAPAASGGSSTNREQGKFYGVPDDYVYEGQQRSFPRRGPQTATRPSAAPRYQTASDDDRRIPLSLPPEQLADLQDALMEVGLIGKAGYRKGVVDAATRNAFAELLGFANQTGSDWQSALLEYATANPVSQEQGEQEPMGAPGNISTVTSTEDLGAVAENVGRGRLGRRLRDDETQVFAEKYQGAQREQNELTANAQEMAQPAPGMDGTDSEIMELPDASVAADQFIDSRYAQEAAGYGTLGAFNVLNRMLGGR